jgi:DNA-binding IclR family transcriptional regulator
VSGRVQSIERGIDVLMSVAERPKTLAEVMRDTKLSKATVFRMLASLGYQNVVTKNGDNTYVLGPGCLLLMQGVTNSLGVTTGAGRLALQELWEETGETVAIHVPLGTDRICVEELPSAAPIRYMSEIGSAAPLTVGSAGRVLLAFLPTAQLTRTLDMLAMSTSESDLRTCSAELEVIRDRGYAMSEGERVRGAAAISTPIFGRQGFVAALSVLGPDFRFTQEQRLTILPALRRTAEAIGKALVGAGKPGERRELD